MIVDDIIHHRYRYGYNGDHRIYGTIKLEADPAVGRHVWLLENISLNPVARVNADQLGAYEFPFIVAGTYVVVGRDRETGYHPDIARVISEPMP